MSETLEIVAEMRRRIAVKMSDAWYTQDEWRNLCDRIEAACRRDAKNYERGNSAAMREALECIKHLFRDIDLDADTVGNEAYRIADLALSAPPRNCDRMPDIDRLTMYDLAKSPCKSTLECASREELLALVRWLLAPASGEGATDGE